MGKQCYGKVAVVAGHSSDHCCIHGFDTLEHDFLALTLIQILQMNTLVLHYAF
jgi:hypothetical protein